MTGLDEFGNLTVWAGILAAAIWIVRIVLRETKWWKGLRKSEISGQYFCPVPFTDDTWWYMDNESCAKPLNWFQWQVKALGLYLTGHKRKPNPELDQWSHLWGGKPLRIAPEHKRKK